ncbi:MAG: endopeptidase La [Bacteroidales bacterium]|nr:endopeptidase La [Bacteroidales bacterium]
MRKNKDIDLDRLEFAVLSDEAEFVPIITSEEEEIIEPTKFPELLPILPLKNTVLFPGILVPITVGRDKSINLIKDAYKTDKTIGVVSQKDESIDDPKLDDINKTGTIAHIVKVLQMPDGSSTAIIQGKTRFEIIELTQTEPYWKAKVKQIIAGNIPEKDESFTALIDSIKDLALQIIKLSPHIPTEAGFAIKNIESSTFLINFVSSNLNTNVNDKQKLLETLDLKERANLLLGFLSKELQMLELKSQIQSKVKVDLDKQQRDFLLGQQLKTIQEELGGNPHEQQIGEMLEKAKTKKWSKQIDEAFKREINKLQRMHPAAAEYSIQINYVETLLDLPWNEFTTDNFDLKTAQKVLDKDHYGLEKVKERIIEHLAVLKLKKNMKSPILCLYGPPGVGKTSLGKSIASALGRNYVRMSLGGLRDEAEIRGHRKTYIGAMPGRIIQNIKKAKSSNPVFVLDEIDKVGNNPFHGDPSSALLEVLDPEQNNSFYDNYLEADYDLSNVLFIATANNINTVLPALKDRMEIIEINGYIIEEKLQIAKRHLIPKQIVEHGLEKEKIKFHDKAIIKIIEDYTRESGVRELEKKVAAILRKKAKDIASGKRSNTTIEAEHLQKLLGIPVFQKDKFIKSEVAGVVTGLAWTVFGGEILFVETSLSKGKGNLTLTGNLGDVMKESATIAYEYLKAHAKKLNIPDESFEKWNVHIHVPEGATPKDGPSAGITMFASLASAFTKRKVKAKLAMTGEITLRGKVLPVGGIKEKILAAKRAGITDIVLSSENKININDINEKYRKGVKFHYINDMIDVIDIALKK